MVGLNETIDQLAMASSVHWHCNWHCNWHLLPSKKGHVLIRRLEFEPDGKENKKRSQKEHIKGR